MHDSRRTKYYALKYIQRDRNHNKQHVNNNNNDNIIGT